MTEIFCRLVLGDARSMRRVPGESVHLIVTSPPYWQLKDYGTEGQVGFHDTYEQYIEELGRVWKECARVLLPGCRAAVNAGDQFARAQSYGRYRVIPIHANITRRMQELGLDFMGSIIWQKVTTCNTSGGGAVMGSFPYPRNGIVKLDYEHVLLFKKPGEAPAVPRERKERAKLTTREWNEYFYGHWSFPGCRQKDHIAVFPEELPRRLIRMFTFPGETVLDPFLGSGTTMKVARELGRSAIGYEINAAFEPVIREKAGFGAERDILAGEASLEVIRETGKRAPLSPRQGNGNGTDRLGSLEGYGSVVRKGDSRYREEYHRVARVSGPLRLEIDDGRSLRLIGLRENARSAGEGKRRLEELLRGQRIYLRSDPLSRDGEAAYVYLKNRTCVNSRLLREGLADVDPAEDFRLKKRYSRYQSERSR